MHRALHLLFSLPLSLLAAPALAQPAVPPGRLLETEEAPAPGIQPTPPHIVMRLDYVRASGAEACPDEQVFRDAVGAQIRKWDPFASNGPWRLRVVVSREGGGYAGSIALRDSSGAVQLERAYPSTPRCIDLLGDLARAVGFKVDPPSPPSLPSPPPVSAQPSVPAPTADADMPAPESSRASAPPPLPTPPPPPRAFLIRLGGSAWADLGSAPRPALGLSLDFGVRVGWASISAEGRFDPWAGARVTSGEIATTRVFGALVPCRHFGVFAGCFLAELGRIWGKSGGAASVGQTRLFGAGGGRLAAEIPVAPHLFLRVALDLTFLRIVPFQLAGRQRWGASPVAGGLGAGVLASF